MSSVQQTVIITGGNSGLGHECAKVLAKEGGWHIVIASRSAERTQRAVGHLIEETGHQSIEAMVLDLASQQSVRDFATAFTGKSKQKSRPPLHTIVCNAGVTLMGDTHYTDDGVETTFGVNHLGHFLLVNLLLAQLQTPARIVFVSSGTHLPEHRLARITGVPKPRYTSARDLAFPEQASSDKRITNQSQRYSTSKLCNVLCAYELSRRLEASGLSTADSPIGVFAIDPGLMPGTGLAREAPPLLYHAFTGVVSLIEPLVGGIRQPPQSGHDLARLVTDPSLRGQTAKYFDGREEVRSSADSYDLEKARDLWKTSVELTGLTEAESPLMGN